jgi:Ala-tRNA(Pro) deacylase
MPDADPAVHDELVRRLREAGVPFTLLHHASVFTSEEAAAIRGAPLCTGAKALILKIDGQFLMAVLPADRSLDSKALCAAVGAKKSRFATKEEVYDMTGLTPGSIPPFGSLFGLPTWCDERLASNDRINFNAASHAISMNMAYADYAAHERPRIAAIGKAGG